jgi:hypothetical protein
MTALSSHSIFPDRDGVGKFCRTGGIVPLSREDVKYIQQAYKAGLERGARLDKALEGAVGYSIAHVDRYSPDQVKWATQRFREERAWRRGPKVNAAAMIRRLRFGELQLTGMEFERYFPEGPEQGEMTATGNIFVSAGLTNLISLWLGLTGAAVNPLRDASTGTSVVGIGTGTTAAATTDTTLISNGGSSWYQGFDATSFGTTSQPGVIVATATIASANANFAWQEWGWFTGSGVVTPGSNGGTAAGSPFAVGNSWCMNNHKTSVALGTKASGSSWVFSTQFSVSL